MGSVISRNASGDRCIDVNPPPFQTLIDTHGQAVHRYLAGAVGIHDAADCYQETMISALRAYERVDATQSLRGWLFTIAHNKAIDHHRGRHRRPTPVSDPPDGPSVADEDHDPELWAAVGDLPGKQRTAIAFRYLGDLAYREIGVALDCSEAAARQNVRAGLRSLEERLTND